MAVRAGTYIELGGMNRRQAGEDFYFLNKADQRFALTEIGATTVYPAARLSARTPFGTGRALSLAAHVGAGSLEVYDPRCYLGVGQVLAGLDSLYGYDGVLDPSKPPEALFAEALGYLESVHWRTVLDEIADQVSSQHAYRKRLRVWFDGFRTMKLIHWLTRKCFPRVAVGSAALEVLGWHEPLGVPRDATNFQLLQRFRGLDRAYAVPSANVG